jgi:hypothetical protein
MSNLLTGNFPYKTYRNLNTVNTGVVIKAGKGQIFEMVFGNTAASTRYVKLYDTASTPDSTFTPIRTYVVFAGTNLVVPTWDGVEFLTGIAIRATTGVADNDNGAPSNDTIVNISWL